MTMVSWNNDNSLPLIGAAASGVLALAGYLGGQTVQVIIPSASPLGYASALGLWAPAGLGMYVIAEKLNPRNDIINIPLAFIGGYFASLAFTNLMGLSVNLLAPFMGLVALAGVAVAISAIAIPVVFLGASVAGFSMVGLAKGFRGA
jgi:hypothetical protein